MCKKLKDLFFPHAGNTYRPTLLERVSVGIMLVLILISFALANLQALFWISSDWLASSVLPSVIVDLTNDERTNEFLGTLARSEVLDRAAKLKAEDMAKNGYFAHYSPSGVSPWYWFESAGYAYVHAGENLAVHFTESNEVVEAWMNSPTHRANIMNGNYNEIGVGTARGEYKGSPTVFVVQLFGTRKEPSTLGSLETAPVTVEKLAVTSTTTDVAPATIAVVIPEEEARNDVSISEEQPVTAPVLLVEAGENVPPVPQAPPLYAEEVVHVENEEPIIVMYSDIATSTDGVPLLGTTGVGEVQQTTPTPLKSATAPVIWLEALYAFLALLVIGVLLFSLIFEWRHHHPVQTAYAGGLLAVMSALLSIHELLTGQVLIV